jgi:transposase-like protein
MSRRGPSYSESEARRAIAASLSYAEALRRLGMCHSGGSVPVLKKWVKRWGISTAHFDPDQVRSRALRRTARPLSEILVQGSTYHRGHLKRRLFDEGIKQRQCEICGQGETWRGRRMSLILDHINGISTDNRLANLRVVCPNCAATLDTHCGRSLRHPLMLVPCQRCGETFLPKASRQRFCSRDCGQRWTRRGIPNPKLRRVERPGYDTLCREIEQLGYSAVGRRYGVSDNAIRKWVRQYELEHDPAYAA